MITSTISVPELIWTIATVIGLFFNARQLRRALGDYIVVKRNRINSIREYAAITTMFMFLSWTFVQAIFTVLGVVAMTSQNPSMHTNAIQYAILTGFISISIFLALSGYIIDARRQALIKKIVEIENFD